MVLTAAQIQTLKNDIAANNDLNSNANTEDGNAAIAALYNTVVAPTFYVYRTNIPPSDIFNQITWANLTPSDAPDTTQQWLNRAMQCQGKQFNIQILLQGMASIDASRANIRAGLQDALTNVPSGTSGATASAGWVPVRDNALARAATRLEKLFATGGNGSTAALAGTMVMQGTVSGADIDTVRAT